MVRVYKAILSLLIASLLCTCNGYKHSKSAQMNHPHPFGAITSISFTLTQKTDYTLTIYDVDGDIAKIYLGTEEAGVYKVTW